MPTSPHLPSDEDGRRLHAELLLGTATAPGEFATAFLRPLANYLISRRNAPDDSCEEAAERAILELIHSPKSYNPERGLSVAAYLRMSARGDLLNLSAKEGRHHDRRISFDTVELTLADRNRIQEDGSVWDEPLLKAVIDCFNAAERITFDLLREAVSDTETFAVALGLTETGAARVATVKRCKDVVKARLRRAVEARDE